MAPKRGRAPLQSAPHAESGADGEQSAADDPRVKRTRVQAEESPSEAAPPRSTPRRSARLAAEAASPKERPPPKHLRFADDGDDSEGEEGAEKEPQYSRIKQYKSSWRPLIPTMLNASAFAAGKRKRLVAFGATFPTAEGAAMAADRALVAMWGPSAATPLLNFHLSALARAERCQRHGRALTAFLQALVAEGEAARAEEKAARARAVPPPAYWAETERRKRRLMRLRASLPVDENEPCGLCPACRQPWLEQRCYRSVEAAKIGYKAKNAAERALEAAGEEESEEEEEEEGQKGKGRGATPKPEATVKTAGTAVAEAAAAGEVLTWHDHPPKQGPALRQARKAHTQHVESARLRAEAEAAEEAAAEAAAVAATLTAARPPGPARAALPRDFIPTPPHPSMLRAASTAAALGASLTLVGEEALPPLALATAAVAEEKGAADDPDGAISRQCPLCMGWHGTRTICPLVAEAYATAVPAAAAAAVCPHCTGAEVPGCTQCGKGKLPDAVWVPPALPAPWLDRITPGTADVMVAARRLAGAAAADYDRPDVADKLGPGALLAMGLLAEHVAAAGLGLHPADEVSPLAP